MKNDKSTSLILCLFGILPVVWLGLLIAPAAHGGLPEIVARFPALSLIHISEPTRRS